MTDEELEELLKELEKLPEFLAEKKRRYYERKEFIERVMGPVYREIFENDPDMKEFNE